MTPVIKVDNAKCVNCYACITACPVKYCIDGSGSELKIRADLCIGCGRCISACHHKARSVLDDGDAFFAALKAGEKIIAIVAPSAAASYPYSYLNLNGYLKSLGVQAVFDVSFGAELCIRSYVNYIKERKPELVIAQPCPAIVTYLEIYHPALLRYLAPVDSPMLHLIKMIREFFSEYRDYKIAAISPCVAKRREFDATGMGDYNVTYLSLNQRLAVGRTDLGKFPAVEFSGPRAERGAAFSTPGGLLTTANRDLPGIWQRTRRIEGVHTVYPYLRDLDATWGKEGKGGRDSQVCFLVDCLSCERGCNGGPGTGLSNAPLNTLEAPVHRRRLELEAAYRDKAKGGRGSLEEVVGRYWKPGLYTRAYTDRSSEGNLKEPNRLELTQIYASIGKHSERDIYDCTSCGYGSCRDMARAIFNRLNQPRNCHHYDLLLVKQGDELKKLTQELQAQRDEIAVMKDNLRAGIFLMNTDCVIQPQYSQALETILEREGLQGQTLFDVLSLSLSAKDRGGLRDYFDMVFQRSFDKQMLDDVNPIHEFEYRWEKGQQKGKTLRTTFALVDRPQGGEPFVMGTFEDITLEKELQRELAEAEQMRQEEMYSLFEVVQVDPQVLNDFIEDTDAEFERINSLLKDQSLTTEVVITEIYQSVHAIKSNALILGFNRFAAMLQELETKIRSLSGLADVPFEDMLHLAVELERMMRERDKLNRALGRITSFSAKITSGPQEKRPQTEYVLEESLRAACRRAAEEEGKEVRFVLKRVDGAALRAGPRRAIKEILIQLVRNGVCHGIEKPEDRLSRGKEAAGTIQASVTLEKGRIHLRLQDDGQGINFDRIREKARQEGFLQQGLEKETGKERRRLLELIFEPRFSTASQVGFQAGRGIGLSLVRDRMRELGGVIKVRTATGEGTVFDLSLPAAEAAGKAGEGK